MRGAWITSNSLLGGFDIAHRAATPSFDACAT